MPSFCATMTTRSQALLIYLGAGSFPLPDRFPINSAYGVSTDLFGARSRLKSTERPLIIMTLDDKIRIGMVALTGGSVVLAALGVHVNPLSAISGASPV